MMKQEFEALAGYEVSMDDYNNIIEPMYMATRLTKQEFVKVIDKKRFALKPLKNIIKEMKKTAEQIRETCDHYYDDEAHEKLGSIVEEYMERKGYIVAGIKTAGFMIDDEMTVFKCYYPSKVSIYSFKDYKTIESIELI